MATRTTLARRAWVGGGVAILAACGGCAGDGLSPRESPHQYADTFYRPGTAATAATAEPPPAAGQVRVGPRVTVSGPVSVAVVQMGEVSPPDTAVRAFLGRPDLFARVDPMAGHGTETCLPTADDLIAYRQAAANLGDDFVLVYGGTLDHRHVTTPLAVFNLTVLGAFVVPSESLTITGRAAGTMVDVRTGRLAFSVTADATASTLQPAASAYGAAAPLADAVLKELEDKLVARTQERLASVRRPAGL